MYNSRAGKEHFWESVPLSIIYLQKNYHIEVRNCHKQDIIEIDNFDELIDVDSSYASYSDSEEFKKNY